MGLNAAGLDVSGKNNPRWRGGDIVKVCEVCKIQYTVKRYHSKSRFCSLQCVGISQRGIKKKTSKQVQLECEVCGKPFSVFKSHAHKWHCCSKECSHKRRATISAGLKNPNWKGGLSREPYPWNFKQISNYIISRDGYKCQNPNCLKTDKRLTAHHIDYNKQNSDYLNLITLCSACNSRANFNRKKWQKFYINLINKTAKKDGGGWVTENF